MRMIRFTRGGSSASVKWPCTVRDAPGSLSGTFVENRRHGPSEPPSGSNVRLALVIALVAVGFYVFMFVMGWDRR